jgi:hypothetical protein
VRIVLNGHPLHEVEAAAWQILLEARKVRKKKAKTRAFASYATLGERERSA